MIFPAMKTASCASSLAPWRELMPMTGAGDGRACVREVRAPKRDPLPAVVVAASACESARAAGSIRTSPRFQTGWQRIRHGGPQPHRHHRLRSFRATFRRWRICRGTIATASAACVYMPCGCWMTRRRIPRGYHIEGRRLRYAGAGPRAWPRWLRGGAEI
jgi:hypothetical protein